MTSPASGGGAPEHTFEAVQASLICAKCGKPFGDPAHGTITREPPAPSPLGAREDDTLTPVDVHHGLMERDRLWCEAMLSSGVNARAIEAITRRFNELRPDKKCLTCGTEWTGDITRCPICQDREASVVAAVPSGDPWDGPSKLATEVGVLASRISGERLWQILREVSGQVWDEGRDHALVAAGVDGDFEKRCAAFDADWIGRVAERLRALPSKPETTLPTKDRPPLTDRWQRVCLAITYAIPDEDAARVLVGWVRAATDNVVALDKASSAVGGSTSERERLATIIGDASGFLQSIEWYSDATDRAAADVRHALDEGLALLRSLPEKEATTLTVAQQDAKWTEAIERVCGTKINWNPGIRNTDEYYPSFEEFIAGLRKAALSRGREEQT